MLSIEHLAQSWEIRRLFRGIGNAEVTQQSTFCISWEKGSAVNLELLHWTLLCQLTKQHCWLTGLYSAFTKQMKTLFQRGSSLGLSSSWYTGKLRKAQMGKLI